MSQTTMTQEAALKWFADMFGLPASSITPETARADISGWDSMGVLTLMSELDETFGLAVNDADMRALKKVGDVIELLRAKGKILP